MRTIENCHNKIHNDTSIEEIDLKRIALYVHHYTNVVYQSENVEIGGVEEHDEISVNMYRSLLNMIIEYNGKSKETIESTFWGIMDDFESDVDATLQNIYIISGYANSNEETRNARITEFVNRVAMDIEQ